MDSRYVLSEIYNIANTSNCVVYGAKRSKKDRLKFKSHGKPLKVEWQWANPQQIKSQQVKYPPTKLLQAKSLQIKSQQTKSSRTKTQHAKSTPRESLATSLQTNSQPAIIRSADAQLATSQRAKLQKVNFLPSQSRGNVTPPAKLSKTKRPFSEPESVWQDSKVNANIDASTQRQLLPVYGVRKRLMEEIGKTDTIIIIGETGSGKTTQVPQFMFEAGMTATGLIGVTQPRRVAAITLSMRVADEMGSNNVGDVVGYTVRFEDVTSPQTKIKFMTDGMLFREAMSDGLLLKYSIIVLDEAHERTVQTDVLFGLVKHAQAERRLKKLNPLKIVVMSATMDVDHFQGYFDNAPVVYVTGRMFGVQVFNAVQSSDDYVFTCLVTVFQIHREAPPNWDILVFLTGQEEIEQFAYNVRQLAKELVGQVPPLIVCPLYSALPSHQQLDVFHPTPVGMRKVILSTNVAETSITIKGIKYVIDSGKVKARTHNPLTGLDVLAVQQISQAQAWQRTGRAGRESCGVCYRVYSKEMFQSMQKNTVPEIQRCNLCSVVLQLLELDIDVLKFDFIDKPPKQTIISALETLFLLGAIKSIDKPHLTKLGHKMALFPLDPKYSKIILSAKDYNCLDEVLSIVALLSGDSVFVSPGNKREKALAARMKFESSAGDHITLLNVYKAYCCIKEKKTQCQEKFVKVWCRENFLNARHLEYASEVRDQLAGICNKLHIPHSSCGQDTELIQKCLITGLFMNIAQKLKDRVYMTLVSKQTATIHPSSVLFNSCSNWILYTEMVHTGQFYLRQLSVIDPDWMVNIVPAFAMRHRLALQCS